MTAQAALIKALGLSVLAPTESHAQMAKELAESIAAGLTVEQVLEAQRIAESRLEEFLTSEGITLDSF